MGVLAAVLKWSGAMFVLQTIKLVVAKVAMWAYTAAVSACTFAMGLLTGASWALLAAIAAVAVGAVTALAPAAVAAYVMYQNWERMRQGIEATIPSLQRFWATLQVVGRGIGDAIYVGDWLAAVNIAWLGIQLIWERGCNYVMNVWDAAVATMAHHIVNFWEDNEARIQEFIDFWDDLSGAAVSFADTAKGVFESVFNYLSDRIDETVDLINDLIEAMNRVTGANIAYIEPNETTEQNTQTANQRFEDMRNNIDANLPDRFAERRDREAELAQRLDKAAAIARQRAIEKDYMDAWASAKAQKGEQKAIQSQVSMGFGRGEIFGMLQSRFQDPAQRVRLQQLAELNVIARGVGDLVRRAGAVFG